MSALFLDRDGVINRRIIDGYVTRREDFVLIDGVLEAIAIFACKFDHIFMVTNQQGIGKGLMTETDLADIHGWFLQQSVMVGDTASDMLFGRRAGMTTVLVGDEPFIARQHPHLVDFCYPDLISYAKTNCCRM